MLDLGKYCFACMRELEQPGMICPACGWDNRIKSNGNGYLQSRILDGRYIIGRVLGRGGFGITYIGRDELGRTVAIKEYYPGNLVTRDFETGMVLPYGEQEETAFARGMIRAQEEGLFTQRIGSIANVVNVYDVLKCNGTVYIVMEFIDGITLNRFIKERGEPLENGRRRLLWTETYALLEPVLIALGKIHQKRIIHRDISPDNIMISREDRRPMILDFGAARTFSEEDEKTHTSTIKTGFSPAEQYNPKSRQDARTDEYAFCATMYYALTGLKPADAMGVLSGTDQLIPPSQIGASDISESVEAVLIKGLSPRQDDRYPSMEALHQAIEDAVHNGGTIISSQYMDPPDRIQSKEEKKPGKPRRRAAWLPAAALLAGTVGILAALGFTGNLPDEVMDKMQGVISLRLESDSASPETDTQDAPAEREDPEEREAPAFEPGPFTSGDFEAELLEDGTCLIIRYTGFASDLTMPETLEGYPVTGLDGYVFSNSCAVETIRIGDHIRKLVDNPFAYCNSLKEIRIEQEQPAFVFENGLLIEKETQRLAAAIGVSGDLTLPEGIQQIGSQAFAACEALYSVTIPEGVTEIGNAAFVGCEKLLRVQIPGSAVRMGENPFERCSSLIEIGLSDRHPVFSLKDGLLTDKQTRTLICALNVSGHVEVPQGIRVIGANAFYDSTNLIGIALPDSVETIGEYAFQMCDHLVSVQMQEGVREIGKAAFAYCSELVDAAIPDSVETIGDRAFVSCSSLTQISIPDSLSAIGDEAFGYCSQLTSVDVAFTHPMIRFQDGFLIDMKDQRLLASAGLSGEVVVPDGVKVIGGSAFADQQQITRIHLPESVEEIGDQAFSYCSLLSAIDLPSGLKRIGDSAFSYCGALTSLSIPAGAEEVGTELFSGCAALEEIHVASGHPTLRMKGGFLIDTKSQTLLFMPDAAGHVRIPEGIVSIDSSAFYGKHAVTGVSIPDSVTKIGDSAFYNCSNLSSVTFSENLKLIGMYAFSDCDSLRTAALPEGVTCIDDSVFSSCSALESVSLPSSLIHLGEGVFSWCNNLKHIEIPLTNSGFRASDGMLVDTTKQSLVRYFGDAKTVVVPEGIRAVGKYAFYNQYAVEKVELPSSLERIEAYAFTNMEKLTALSIPQGVRFIGDSALYNCSELKEVSIPKRTEAIGDGMFRYCDALEKISVAEGHKTFQMQNGMLYDKQHRVLIKAIGNRKQYSIPQRTRIIQDYAFSDCSQMTAIEIPSGVVRIGDYAFDGCDQLSSVSLPRSVLNIGDSAFSSSEKLEKISIPGNVVRIGNYAFQLSRAIKSISVAEGVRYIGDYAFANSSELQTISLPGSLAYLGECAFYACYGLEAVTLSDDHPLLCIENGMLIDKANSVVVRGLSVSDTIEIPEGVTGIDSGAFYGCDEIRHVEIPQGVISIGDDAFSMCSSLEYVGIPQSVQVIDGSPFERGAPTMEVVIDEGNTAYRIENDMLISLGNMHVTALIRPQAHMQIPHGVKGVDNWVFYFVSELVTLKVPESVEFFDEYAFYPGFQFEGLYGVRGSAAERLALQNDAVFVEWK